MDYVKFIRGFCDKSTKEGEMEMLRHQGGITQSRGEEDKKAGKSF